MTGQFQYPKMLAEFFEQTQSSDVFEFRSNNDRLRLTPIPMPVTKVPPVPEPPAPPAPPPILFKSVRRIKLPASQIPTEAARPARHEFVPFQQ